LCGTEELKDQRNHLYFGFRLFRAGWVQCFFPYCIFGQIWRNWDNVSVIMAATLSNQPNYSFKADGYAAA